MKIALLSDIHGNLAALEAVVQDARSRGVDAFVNLGDSVSGPLLPSQTAQYLMAQPWMHLAGNHERQLLTHGPERLGPSDAFARSRLNQTELDWLASLTPVRAWSEEVLLCHGTPSSDIEYFLESVDESGLRAASAAEIEQRLGEVSATVVVCGHTHVPRSVRTKRGQLIVNPGSVGLQAYDDDRPMPHAVETGAPDARYAVLEHRNGSWAVALMTVPYDHHSMAALAARNGRPDWEIALLTGYIRT
jgi:putative phosphoesterase